jgi:MYXO-CTERM domain-containing protein
MLRRVPVLALIVLAGVLALANIARADGDPASDVLLGENVFYPYAPAVPGSLQKTLNTETAAAAKQHFPLKVALIGSPVDLGVIPDLFGKPQQYADFLVQEISFQRHKQPLLVVMSTGYGVQGLDAKTAAAVARIPKPAGKSNADLARAAIGAVAALARASGNPLTGVPGINGTSSSGSSSTTIVVIVLAVGAALVAAALAILTARRRREAQSQR